MGSNQAGGSGTGYSGSSPSSWGSLNYNPMNQALGSGQYFPGNGGITQNNGLPYYQDPTIADASLGLNNWSFSPGTPSAGGGTNSIEGYIYGGDNPFNPMADALPIYSAQSQPIMPSAVPQTTYTPMPSMGTGPVTSAGVDQSQLSNPAASTTNTSNTPASSVPANSTATWNPAWGTMPSAAGTNSTLGGSTLSRLLGKG